MAITVTEPIKTVLYQPGRADTDPRPIGHWTGTRVFPGDATAGLVTMTFAPSSAREAASYLWSLEGVNIRCVGAGYSADAYMTLTTGEPDVDSAGWPNNRLFTQVFQVLNAPAALGRATIGVTHLPAWPWSMFNYIHQPSGGLTNSIMFVLTPNTNLIEYLFNVWGYLWHPQARRLAGGPVRP